MRLIRFNFFLFWTVLSSTLIFASEDYYDEIRNNGEIREAYEDVMPIVDEMDPKERSKFLKVSRKLFANDNSLYFIPRIVEKSEFDHIKAGVEQRGRAIHAFLKDYYSNGQIWKKIIPPVVLENIIARSFEQDYKGLVNPEKISFMYGPDLIKSKNGTWHVIEDNPGYIGGVGDLIKAREILFKLKPEFKEVFSSLEDPKEFYEKLVKDFKSKAKGGEVVFIGIPPYPDNEDKRIQSILKSLGVIVVTPNTQWQIEIVKKNAYIVNEKTKEKKKVGFVWLGEEHWLVDYSHPAVLKKLIQLEVESHLEEIEVERFRNFFLLL
jgi:hypothetical protein